MADDKDRVTAPSAMYIKAIDMLLNKMVQSGFDFARVVALAGDGQVSTLSWDSVKNVLAVQALRCIVFLFINQTYIVGTQITVSMTCLD